MLGAIIGDIIGSRFEFNNHLSTRFELFTPECSYTDDTILTVAIADAAMNHKTYKDALLEWYNKYPNPMGCYGTSFSRWARSEDHAPYNSFGNGAAMRVSSIGWLFDDPQQVMREAKETASCSHNHIEGIVGAVATAIGIWILRNNSDINTFIKKMSSMYPGFRTRKYPVGVFDESCQGTVPVALQIITEATGFEDAIRRAVAHGGDSDTLADITGALAEARWGIPKHIYDRSLEYLTEDMLEIVSQFYNKMYIKYGYNKH